MFHGYILIEAIDTATIENVNRTYDILNKTWTTNSLYPDEITTIRKRLDGKAAIIKLKANETPTKEFVVETIYNTLKNYGVSKELINTSIENFIVFEGYDLFSRNDKVLEYLKNNLIYWETPDIM